MNEQKFREKIIMTMGAIMFVGIVGYLVPDISEDSSNSILKLFGKDKSSKVIKKDNKKIINFNNKDYLVEDGIGTFNTRNYTFISPPINPSLLRLGVLEIECYVGNLDNSILRLTSYTKYIGDNLVNRIEDQKNPEFNAKQDTLEMLFKLYGN